MKFPLIIMQRAINLAIANCNHRKPVCNRAEAREQGSVAAARWFDTDATARQQQSVCIKPPPAVPPEMLGRRAQGAFLYGS